ncbi:MAG: site-specific integrase [Thiomonas sp.]
MGTITNRQGRWRAEVRRKGYRAQCKTFATKAEAQIWIRKTEVAMDAGAASPVEHDKMTIGDVIATYKKLRANGRPISDSTNEHYMLKALERGLGDVLIGQATPERIVAYAQMRKEEGAGPYTINMDISKLGTVLRFGGTALKIAPLDIVGAARPLLLYLRLIGGGGKRERRPTDDELERLLAYFETQHGEGYADAVKFAAITAMRRGEVCDLKLSDLEPSTKIARVMRKHPRLGKTLERVPLIRGAWELATSQPLSEDGRIFPIHPQTLSKYFTSACKALSIPDLHFHDLRHEGTSSLFEDGYSIAQVALVTGHKDWRNLKRYTNLRPEDLTIKDIVKRQPGDTDPDGRQRRDSLQSGGHHQDRS